jgi:hypothetical protein
MFTLRQLNEMSQMDINKMDVHNLVDVGTVKIDGNLPMPQRMEQYLNQIKNPYCFRSGEIKVKIAFSPDGNSLDNTLINFFVGLKSC